MPKALAIEWIKDIKPINITGICEKIEDEAGANNNYDWQFFFDRNKIKSMAEKFLNELNFHNLDLTHYHGTPWWHYSGAFTLEPWDKLNESEGEIMNWINQDFLQVVEEEGEIKIRFVNNPKGKSKLYRWFLKEDDPKYSNRKGWGGNIVVSINDALSFAEKWIEEKIGTNSEKYGDWSENTSESDETEEEE